MYWDGSGKHYFAQETWPNPASGSQGKSPPPAAPPLDLLVTVNVGRLFPPNAGPVALRSPPVADDGPTHGREAGPGPALSSCRRLPGWTCARRAPPYSGQ